MQNQQYSPLLSLHPITDLQAIQDWLHDSHRQFSENECVYPLALTGETGSGRNYLLNAASFDKYINGCPVIIIPIEMDALDASDVEAQFEYMRLKVSDLQQQLQTANAGLWDQRWKLLDATSVQAPPVNGLGSLAFAITLGSFRFLKNLPPFLDEPQNTENQSDESLNFQIEDMLQQLTKKFHVVLHIRKAELMDQGILGWFNRVVRRTNHGHGDKRGFLGLAFSYLPETPLFQQLGENEQYKTVAIQSFSKPRIQQALYDNFGQFIASHSFINTLLNHAGFLGNKVDPSTVGHLLQVLLQENLIVFDQGRWDFANNFNADTFSATARIGARIEEAWHQRLDSLPEKQREWMHYFFLHAAMGGEWIPVNILLDYLNVNNPATRDKIINLLNEQFCNCSPSLLTCYDFQVAGMRTANANLTYRLTSPLLPQVILNQNKNLQQAATNYLSHLGQLWGEQPLRNQSAYLLQISKFTDQATREEWREKLRWQTEVEFNIGLQEQTYQQLIRGQVLPATLSKLIYSYQHIWSGLRREALCQAWYKFYEDQQTTIDLESTQFQGQEWEVFWSNLQNSDDIIPSNNDGLHLCYHLGLAKKDQGDLQAAAYLYNLGLLHCEKYTYINIEAQFHRELSTIEVGCGNVDSALNRLQNKAIPLFKQSGNIRSVAISQGQIADILQVRGQLDEALRIRQTDQLPIFEQLGDVRSKAATMERIADILQARGQLDEALHIREKEVLPIFEQLGNTRDIASARNNIAIQLWVMDAEKNAPKVQELLCLALTDARHLQIPEAQQIEDTLEQMGLSCSENTVRD